MADTTKIEWTDSTWNPITGCTLVSDGCRYCYAAQLAATRLKNHPSRKGLARLNAAGEAKFTGEVRFNEQWLDQPLRWRKPRMIFVCAHGDLFHENVPDEWIDRVFAVMALAPQHTFQVLTKRPERARTYMAHVNANGKTRHEIVQQAGLSVLDVADEWMTESWPLPNVWIGTSVEDQATAEARIPHLLTTPAAVRFISAEPLLGPVNLLVTDTRGHDISALRGIAVDPTDPDGPDEYYRTEKLDWVIVGGESGKKARPMHPDWVRSLRDQCAAAGTAFFFKQWGTWLPGEFGSPPELNFQDGSWMDANTLPDFDHDDDWRSGYANDEFDGHALFVRAGKKRAGRLLDGQTWDQMPAT